MRAKSKRELMNLHAAAEFIEQCGLTIVYTDNWAEIEKADGWFLQGVGILEGCLYWGMKTDADDLLHEAGHLATLPPSVRCRVYGDVDAAIKEAFDRGTGRGDGPGTFLRALIQAGEQETMAWQYAAGMAIGMQPEEVFPENKYDYEAADNPFWEQYCIGYGAGITGLEHGGMTWRFNSHARAFEKPYPAMRKWVQDWDDNGDRQ